MFISLLVTHIFQRTLNKIYMSLLSRFFSLVSLYMLLCGDFNHVKFVDLK